jgi:hypothetical protein
MAKRGHDDPAKQFGASKAASTLLVLFIPSVDRFDKPIPQNDWVRSALDVLGELFGGATAFPKARGVWRDDSRGGKLIYDRPVVIQCYTTARMIARFASQLRQFLVRMGGETNQGAVGFVIDRDYFEIGFPLGEQKQ